MAAPLPPDNAPASAPHAYCRGCGYSLRGLAGGNCPECGRAFDLADRRTVGRRPPRLALWRWVRRTAALVVVLALAAGSVPAWYWWEWRAGQEVDGVMRRLGGSVPAWYWWEWRAEQKVVDELRLLGAEVQVKRITSEGATGYLPERWAFLRDRAWWVRLSNLTAERAWRLDLGSP